MSVSVPAEQAAWYFSLQKPLLAEQQEILSFVLTAGACTRSPLLQQKPLVVSGLEQLA